TVAIEDANFWHEGGIDPAAILRAALADLSRHRIVQGGSTIVQQLVKQRVTGDSETLFRKLREAVIATQINGTTSKQQILEMYLNTVFYGNNAYGGQAAAQTFFHIDANQLDLAQASMLAGLPQNPNADNPLLHWDAARHRQRQVLDAMVRNNSITAKQSDQAYAEDLRAPQHMFGDQPSSLAPAFTDWINQQLAGQLGQKAIDQGGLRITTSLDWHLQQLAQAAVTSTVAAERGRNLSDGAMVAIDPRSGDVLAMVGSAGASTPGGEINLALTPRNPGSTFKLFTYTAAIASKKYTMVTPIRDAQLTVTLPHETYQPTNDDHRYHGICPLQQCLGNSLNIPAVEVEMGVGVPTVVNQARAMGAAPYQHQGSGYTDQANSNSFGPALTLGGYPETVLRMAGGAAVLANQGVLHPPRGLISAQGPNT
ncbi:MAG: transglycosylase domain-containing protein, partial [Candidatus Dormibacteraceae bacterium]